MKADSVLADFTTNSLLVVRKMDKALRERGAALLDAPVSGGVEGARRGELTVLVGDEANAIAVARPVLDQIAKNVMHTGQSGTASICTVLHNCVVFCTNLAMIECLTAGIKAGVTPAMMVETFQESGIGRNLDLQVAMPATLFRGGFRVAPSLKDHLQDVGRA